jgi:hypothetical protein
MKYPLTQTYSGGSINFDTVLDDAITGYDTAKQKDPITKLSLAFNELPPDHPRSTNGSTTTLSTRRRASPAGSPKGDPIYQQAALTTSRSS